MQLLSCHQRIREDIYIYIYLVHSKFLLWVAPIAQVGDLRAMLDYNFHTLSALSLHPTEQTTKSYQVYLSLLLKSQGFCYNPDDPKNPCQVSLSPLSTHSSSFSILPSLGACTESRHSIMQLLNLKLLIAMPAFQIKPFAVIHRHTLM